MISATNFVLYNNHKQKIAGPLHFSIQSKKMTIIRGPNGSGKSSLLKHMATKKYLSTGELQCPTSAEIAYFPQDYANDFQIPASIDEIFKAFAIKQEDRTLTSELNADLLWRTCSGGEKQRVLLDIILAQKFKVLLMDEPLNNLDYISKEKLWKKLLSILKYEHVQSIIVVSHELPEDIGYDEIALV
jgi:ABC-type Mn2+/Zn2+ transport system ATPase subunit